MENAINVRCGWNSLLPEVFSTIKCFTNNNYSTQKENTIYHQLKPLYVENKMQDTFIFSLVCKRWKYMLENQVHHGLQVLANHGWKDTLGKIKWIRNLHVIVNNEFSVFDVLDMLPTVNIPILEITLQQCAWTDQDIWLLMSTLEDRKQNVFKLSLMSCPYFRRPCIVSSIQAIVVQACPRISSIYFIAKRPSALKCIQILDGVSFSDFDILKLLHRCPQVQSLSLVNCGNVQCPVLYSKTLTRIEFRRCKQLKCIDTIVNCCALTTLHIEKAPKLNPRIKSKTLRSVTIKSCQNIAWDAVQFLTYYCPELQSLSLKYSPTTHQYPPGWEPNIVCPTLKHLKLNACYAVTDGTISRLGTGCPNLTSLSLCHLSNVRQPKITNTMLHNFQICSCLHLCTNILFTQAWEQGLSTDLWEITNCAASYKEPTSPNYADELIKK